MNDVDWYRSDTYYDIRQEEENRERDRDEGRLSGAVVEVEDPTLDRVGGEASS